MSKALTTAPVLAYLLTKGRMILDADASNYSIGAVVSQLVRWLELSQYSFVIQHRAGKSHGNADALSRREGEICDCYNAGNSLKSLQIEVAHIAKKLKSNGKGSQKKLIMLFL